MIGTYKGHPLKLSGKRKSRVVGLPNTVLSGFKRARDISLYMNRGYSAARAAKKLKTGSISSLLQQNTRQGRELQEGGNSLTKCHFGSHRCYIPESVLYTLQRQVKVYNTAGSFESATGTQAAVWLSFADPTSLYGMLPSVNDKMILHSIKAEIAMVNSSSTNSTLMVYDIVCRKDCNSANTGSPNGAWQVGIDDAGGSSTDYKIIGSVPTESVLFNEYYKIVQRTRVSLSPGQMHRHEVSYNPNKVLSGEYLNNVTYGIAGITIGTMVVQYGMPAHDSTTSTSVTVDVGALDYITKVSYDWRELENSVTSWTKGNNLATSFAVGEQFVNEAVGQVQDAGGLHPGTIHT